MKIIETKSLQIPEIEVTTYARFKDDRGYFTETWRKKEFEHLNFVQANESFSRKNTVRGLHFQWSPYQGKLARCIHGHLIDFALDIRPDSPTFKKIIGYEIISDGSEEKAEWIWIPPGFAHGVIFPKDTIIEYFCTGEWSPGNEAGISPFAQDIDWSLCDKELKEKYFQILNGNPLITEKDKNGMSLEEWEKHPESQKFLTEKICKKALMN